MTKASKTNSKTIKSKPIKPAPSKSPSASIIDFAIAKERTKLLPVDHAALELVDDTSMNFLQLELVIDEFWRRNLEVRERLGLRPNQDVRTAECPEGMSDAEFEEQLWAIDRATIGMLEGICSLWGHSVRFECRPYEVRELNTLAPKAARAKPAAKAKQRAKKKSAKL